jgi:hypothetical protein
MSGSDLVRKKVRDTIKSLLLSNTGAGLNVFTSRVNKAFGEELPAIFIYTPSDTPILTRKMEQNFNRNLTVNVEVIVDQKDEVDVIEDLADVIAGQVEDILLPNIFLQYPAPGNSPYNADPLAGPKLVNYIQITDTNMVKADDIKEDAYGIVLQFTVEYYYCKQTNAFEEDFKRFGHTYITNGSDPSPNLTEIPPP